MKQSIIFSVLCLYFFSGCSLRQREIELEKKFNEVHEREQQLSSKEQSLDYREQQLNEREKLLDSATRKIENNNLYILHPQLPGTWSVKMQCIETSCTGSAVGDTKNELWDFKFQDNKVIARATSNNQLIRIYSGIYNGNSLKLYLQQDSTGMPFAKMAVSLQEVKDKEMEGEREIIQQNGCRIVYSLQLRKL